MTTDRDSTGNAVEGWGDAAVKYRNQLIRVLEVKRQLDNLARLPDLGIAEEDRQQWDRIAEPLARQLARLEAGEFRVAVVGLENAGKSTFVNAWLDHDILPNDSSRCTYTTTQIRSIMSEQEQRIEIIPKTTLEFEELVKALEEKSTRRPALDGVAAVGPSGEMEPNSSMKDLEVIRRHRQSLERVIAEGEKSISFLNLEDIASDLRRYVADESVAHAVKEVRIYTTRLASTGGIVFFDVPGMNSGLAKLEADSETMLRDCDAVIIIKESRSPDPNGSEEALLKFIREGDPCVSVAGKTFVFITRIDEEPSVAQMQANWDKARAAWQREGRSLPEQRIVRGSPLSYLLISNAARPELAALVGGAEPYRQRLAGVIGKPAGEVSVEDTGIPAIRRTMRQYLETERIEALARRCDEPSRKIREAARALSVKLSERFPDDPAEAESRARRARNLGFGREWRNI